MANVTQDQVKEVLKTYIDPNLDSDLVSAKAVKDISVDGDKVSVKIVLGYPARGIVEQMSKDITDKLMALDGVNAVDVDISWKIVSHVTQKNVKGIDGVKNIIAVASGKGGVGKSTTSVNLALALSAEGATVGILDADIYGPSQPRMVGISGKPESEDGQNLEPMNNYDIQSMSIGYLIEEDTPMIWRGPMVTQALEQLLKETAWKDLD